MRYRVILKVGYNEAFFDFDTAEAASKFATEALKHTVPSEDTKKPLYVTMLIAESFDDSDK